MLKVSSGELKAIRPYSLGAMPFIGLFIYQIAIVLPQRPTVADSAKGFVIAIGVEDKTVYMSQMDAIILFGAFLIAFAIIGMGLLKVFRRVQ